MSGAAGVVADLLLRATAVLAVAFLVDRVALRRASAAARHLCWTVAVVALLALPAARFALPAWHVALPAAERPAPAVVAVPHAAAAV
ncbi:hypothetical protein, partial [Roseisolibacter sp. H3M3-2]|uniref:hypothetical protein n=1 Tax=Roseisolibacter sp. H3M3-2 TaxID=3031323 RepID=UPI0023DBBE73